jgi:hypothetical protein
MSMNDRYLVPQMLQVVYLINPDYPGDIDIDGKPLLKIATFIYNQMKLHYGPENHAQEILPIWEQLYTVVYNDKFYKDKSLSTIANHIQEFWQKAKNGSKQISGSKLKDKLAARLKGRK